MSKFVIAERRDYNKINPDDKIKHKEWWRKREIEETIVKPFLIQHGMNRECYWCIDYFTCIDCTLRKKIIKFFNEKRKNDIIINPGEVTRRIRRQL